MCIRDRAGEGRQEIDVGDERPRPHRPRVQPRVRVDQRDPQRLLVEVEVLLPQAAVGEPHLAVVGGADDQGVVEEARLLQLVEDGVQVGVGGAHQVAVEVQVVALLLRRPELAGEVEDPQELRLHGGLGREVLDERRRQINVNLAL